MQVRYKRHADPLLESNGAATSRPQDNDVRGMMPREHKGASILANKNDYVAFDLETTGLDPRWDDIIEIGAVKVRNGQPADRYEQLINPGRPIPSIITEITGINDDMVKDAPALADILPGFLEWIGDDILLGHNVNFDINFLYDNAEELGEKPVDNDFIDTLRLARYLYPEERHNRLRDLIARFDIAETQQHRALADVEQTVACYQWMLHHMEKNNIPFPTGEGRRRGGTSPLFRGEEQLLQIAPQDEITPDPAFEGHTFVFTGALKKMTRANAQQAVTNLGGINGKSVTKETNYLVTGSTDYNSALKGAKSSKWLKAEKLQLAGQDIAIISEDVFYDMLGDSIAEASSAAASEPEREKESMWDSAAEPVNVKPSGTEIEAHLNADVLHSTDHQDKLSEYGRDRWVWVTLTKSEIPEGEGKGHPTAIISLDGKQMGWLSKKRASQHMSQIPDGTVVAKAFIKHRKAGLALLVYLPWDE